MDYKFVFEKIEVNLFLIAVYKLWPIETNLLLNFYIPVKESIRFM